MIFHVTFQVLLSVALVALIAASSITVSADKLQQSKVATSSVQASSADHQTAQAKRDDWKEDEIPRTVAGQDGHPTLAYSKGRNRPTLKPISEDNRSETDAGQPCTCPKECKNAQGVLSCNKCLVPGKDELDAGGECTTETTGNKKCADAQGLLTNPVCIGGTLKNMP